MNPPTTPPSRKGRIAFIAFLVLMLVAIMPVLAFTFGPVSLRRHFPLMGGVAETMQRPVEVAGKGVSFAMPVNYFPVTKHPAGQPVPYHHFVRRGLHGEIACRLNATAPEPAGATETARRSGATAIRLLDAPITGEKARLLALFAWKGETFALDCSGPAEDHDDIARDVDHILNSLILQ